MVRSSEDHLQPRNLANVFGVARMRSLWSIRSGGASLRYCWYSCWKTMLSSSRDTSACSQPPAVARRSYAHVSRYRMSPLKLADPAALGSRRLFRVDRLQIGSDRAVSRRRCRCSISGRSTSSGDASPYPASSLTAPATLRCGGYDGDQSSYVEHTGGRRLSKQIHSGRLLRLLRPK